MSNELECNADALLAIVKEHASEDFVPNSRLEPRIKSRRSITEKGVMLIRFLGAN